MVEVLEEWVVVNDEIEEEDERGFCLILWLICWWWREEVEVVVGIVGWLMLMRCGKIEVVVEELLLRVLDGVVKFIWLWGSMDGFKGEVECEVGVSKELWWFVMVIVIVLVVVLW